MNGSCDCEVHLLDETVPSDEFQMFVCKKILWYQDPGGILTQKFRYEIEDSGTHPEVVNPKRVRVSGVNCKEAKPKAKTRVHQEKMASKRRIHRDSNVHNAVKVLYSFKCQNEPDSIIMEFGELLINTLDAYLSRYVVIIVDEAHERTLQSYVLLGLLNGVGENRTMYFNEHKMDNVKANDIAVAKEETDVL